jgi:Protein of unknown function (DUF2795)
MSAESEQNRTAESEQDALQYVEDVDYSASREDLVSAAKGKNAPQEVIELLEGLEERGSEYNGSDEVREALAYEDQEIEHHES